MRIPERVRVGYGYKRGLAYRLIGGVLATIGYILSPMSWWNDLVVNVPLALAFAKLLNFAAGVPYTIGFTLGYWISNIAGIILMVYGGGVAASGRVSRRNLAASLLVASIYTVVAVLILQWATGR